MADGKSALVIAQRNCLTNEVTTSRRQYIALERFYRRLPLNSKLRQTGKYRA